MARMDRYTGDERDKRIEAKRRKLAKRKKGGGKRRDGMLTVRLIVIAVLLLIVVALILRLVFYVSSISRVHLTDEGLTHAERYADFVKVHGIDVSEFQDDIKWKKVKSSEADFAFIRAGYRKSDTGELCTDADFETNIKGANKAGIMTGAYFFSQAVTTDEAVEEAEYLLDLVKPYEIDLPLVIDFELIDGGRLAEKVAAGEMPAASNYHDIVVAFCSRVEEAGYEAAVYANYDMLTNYMDSELLDDQEFVWAAEYGGECHVKGNYMFWQASEDAQIAGIEGSVDHDIWYIDPNKVYSTYAKGNDNAVSIENCKIKFNKDSYKLTNHRAIPKIQVTYEGKSLRKGTHYEVSYVRNTTEGTGYAIIRGIDSYKNWIAVPFTIE